MKVIIAFVTFLAVASASPKTRGVATTLVKTNCSPDQTDCPAGCCPEANWFCCPDGQYCAATSNDCPYKGMILKSLLK